MGLTTLIVGVAAAVLTLVGLRLIGRLWFDRQTTRAARALLSKSNGVPPGPAPTDVLEGLPPPIRRYLTRVLAPAQPYVECAYLEQSGTFRSTDDAPWSRFAASQHVTTCPPGFVWDASIGMIPGIPVRVVDEYREGSGGLQAKLGGVLSVANAPPASALDEAELMRYLAETPLYPTALLPTMGVEWTPIDQHSARAVLRHGGTTAELVFHVNEEDEVDRVSGRRSFMTDDGAVEQRGWVGNWWNYRERDGMLIPADGKVGWVGHNGAFTYWRGHIDHIDYRYGPLADAHATRHSAESRPTSDTLQFES